MPNTPPDGFLTRPEAAKVYNRSQRALERDITKAVAMRDERGLVPWKLVTKDGEVRAATDVTSEQVEQLVNEGMVPTWCVSVSWLEETYGRKGSPKPTTNISQANSHSPSDSQQSPVTVPQDVPGKRGESSNSLSSHTEFLKERIRIMEREKREEAERNERRESKLFAELDVKNKQIAAWDEITQGLTKALATGKIAPRLLTGVGGNEPQQPVADVHTSKKGESVNEAQVVEPAIVNTETKVKKTAVSRKSKSPRSKSPPKARAAKKSLKNVFEKHTPTFHRAVSGFLRHTA